MAGRERGERGKAAPGAMGSAAKVLVPKLGMGTFWRGIRHRAWLEIHCLGKPQSPQPRRPKSLQPQSPAAPSPKAQGPRSSWQGAPRVPAVSEAFKASCRGLRDAFQGLGYPNPSPVINLGLGTPPGFCPYSPPALCAGTAMTLSLNMLQKHGAGFP